MVLEMEKLYDELSKSRFIDIVDENTHYILIFEKDDGSLKGLEVPKNIPYKLVNVSRISDCEGIKLNGSIKNVLVYDKPLSSETVAKLCMNEYKV